MGKSEKNKFQIIPDSMFDGYAYLKIIFDEGNIPVDGTFILLRGAFDTIAGLRIEQVIGKRVSEIFPELLTADPEIVQTLGKVALTGGRFKIEYYLDTLDKWFSTVIFNDSPGYLTVFFQDITQTKRTIEQIKKLSQTALKYLEFNIAQIDYQMLAEDLLQLTGAGFTLINTYNKTANSVTTQAIAGDVATIEKAKKILGTLIGRNWEIKDNSAWFDKSEQVTKLSGVHELMFELEPSQTSIAIETAIQMGEIYRFSIGNADEALGDVLIIMTKGKGNFSPEIVELYVRQLEAALVRKKAEAELNFLTDQYATVFNGSQDLMFLINIGPNGEFLFDMVNKKCEERFRLKNDEIKGKTIRDLFGKEFGDIFETKYRQCIEAKAPTIYEETYNFLGQARIGHTILSPVIKEGEVIQIIGSTRDVTEQKQAEDRIKYLSFYDDLTGLYNRSFFEEELKRLDTERQLPISIIIIDVNGLKLVNDAFGHQEGDELLIATTKIIEKSCRSDDIICRWGGDEFVILLPQCDDENAEKVCRRIKSSDLKKSQDLIPISLALGTATKKESDQNIQEVLRNAEDRMYRNKLLESKSSRSSILASLQKTLQERTHETEEHELRLRNLALKIGKAIGLSGDQLDELVLLAALHDIGKIAVPDHILKKPGPLSQDEWVIMKRHAEIGCRITKASPELALISELILSHHERWDGTGYPRRLKGEQIPLPARILSVIDAFDAMTNTRPYRTAITQEDAFSELHRNAGKQFDPELVKIFIEMNK